MSLHIAILDTDVPVPTVYAARGLYSSQFRVLLQSAAARLSQSSSPGAKHVQIHTSAYDVVGGAYPALDMLKTSPSSTTTTTKGTIDALLITGSAASAYYQGAQYQWIAQLQSFLRRVWTDYPAVKMFGSCFGHQIIAQALLGGTVQVEACPMGYEVGIHPISLNPAFATGTLLGRMLAAGLKSKDGKLRVQLVHGDRVVGLVEQPWLNIGSTQLSPVQGLYYPGRVLTYQGHFEFDAFVNAETVLEFARRCAWAEPVVSEYLRRIASCAEDDAELAAAVVVLFLTESAEMHPAVETGLATPPDESCHEIS
ncbi:hypothetical protein UA08_09034 [Talaromyces atroroseus]|uniref:Glutamine amidotransferase domain-containing protein n=1 Tax=Talaromyces atroroseus TaxID=1441469 RepID=A0A1Q5Q6Z0_TALAT|nr:hypothetical protein UA08_09034 [Talaromyces atroroseus]OKL55609.1 hypothetical protein UA08_09034 [Talaromyces atroroseus]